MSLSLLNQPPGVVRKRGGAAYRSARLENWVGRLDGLVGGLGGEVGWASLFDR